MMMRRWRSGSLALGMACGLAWGAVSVAAQETGVRVSGRLLIGADSIPVARAHVVAADGTPVRTDRQGRFTLLSRTGEQRFTAVVVEDTRERIYTALLRVPDRDEVRFVWWVDSEVEASSRMPDEPIPLEGIVVTVNRRILEMRPGAVRGDYLDRQDIESLGPGIQGVADLARRLVGVHVVPSQAGAVCIVPRRGRREVASISGDLESDPELFGPQTRGCPEMITVVLDGLVLRDAAHAVAAIPRSDIESVSFVGGISATQLYGRHGRWGALVIETRRP